MTEVREIYCKTCGKKIFRQDEYDSDFGSPLRYLAGANNYEKSPNSEVFRNSKILEECRGLLRGNADKVLKLVLAGWRLDLESPS